MQLEKAMGHTLSDKVADQNRVPLTAGTKYRVTKASFAPGSVGRFDLTPDQTSGGGPFSANVVDPSGNVVQHTLHAVGGALLSCTVGGKHVGALPNLDDVEYLDLTITEAGHQAKFFGNYG